MRIICRCCFFLLVCFPVKLSAQLWNGNLGAPILNIDFGSSSPYKPPPGSTSYRYAQGCPSPGYYSIENYLFGCANNTWIELVGNHTPDDNKGYYMLVNPATVPAGDAIVQTVDGLCGNTTYQFSAWIVNVMKKSACDSNPLLPKLTLSIETISGTVLASYSTGDLPVTERKNWTEYGVCYTTTTPMSVVLRIKSNNTGNCGLSFMLDDITLKPAGPAITSTLNGNSFLNFEVCRGYTDKCILEASYGTGFGDPVVQWQSSLDTGKTWKDLPGDTTTTYIVPHRDDKLIVYRLRLSERTNIGNDNCCVFSNRFFTNVHYFRNPNPLKHVLGCLDKDLMLVPSLGYLSYQWKGPNGFHSDKEKPVIPRLQYVDSGLYTVLITNADFGCTVQDSFLVNISPSTTISTQTLYNICEGETVNLSATGDGTYEWTPATGLSGTSIPNPVAMPHDSIEYKVVLTNVYGCKDSANVVINVFKRLEMTAGPDKKILIGDTVLLDGSVKGTAINYYWSASGTLNDVTAIRPAVFPTEQTQYTLNAVSSVGCGNAKSATVTVRVYKDFLIPTAFSPNGDGLNDVYHVLELDSYKLVAFSIFNRWGVKVFSTTNVNTGWDGNVKGNPQDPGIYMYYLEMKHPSGKTISRKGSITLIK
jgi:gliding motility-associated-like protein